MTDGPTQYSRAREALEALRPEDGIRDRLHRVRLTAMPIVQSSVAAAAAWFIAHIVVGHEQPFFAPIAALISVGVGLGQRLTRVVELVAGVALGVLVGDALVGIIGSGWWQIAVVVALAMTAAVLLGGGAVIVTQAAASAVLVVALVPSADGVVNIDRFVDTSVGGLVGIAVSGMLLPVNPVSVARRKLNPLLDTLSEVLDDGARALIDRDRALATRALARARETQNAVDDLHDALEGSAEIARIAPVRWRARGQLVGYLDAAEPVDYITRDMRVLMRHLVATLRRDEPVPDTVPQALRALAGAIRLLRIALEQGDEPHEAQASAIAAAEMATEALDHTGGFAGQVVVAQARSLAVDVLVGAGVSREDTLKLLPHLPRTR